MTNTGKVVFALPDKQRLISRLHMKHYCDKRGFPREIPWLSNLEPYVISNYRKIQRCTQRHR